MWQYQELSETAQTTYTNLITYGKKEPVFKSLPYGILCCICHMEGDTLDFFRRDCLKTCGTIPTFKRHYMITSQIPVWLFGTTRTNEVRQLAKRTTCNWGKPDPQKPYYATGPVPLQCKLLKYFIYPKTLKHHFQSCRQLLCPVFLSLLLFLVLSVLFLSSHEVFISPY